MLPTPTASTYIYVPFIHKQLPFCQNKCAIYLYYYKPVAQANARAFISLTQQMSSKAGQMMTMLNPIAGTVI